MEIDNKEEEIEDEINEELFDDYEEEEDPEMGKLDHKFKQEEICI